MEKLKMYKEMDIKFPEFDAAMLRLGYQKTTNEQFIIYQHDASGSKVFLSQFHKSQEILNKGWIIANSYNMESSGVINHYFDLAKLVEKMRIEIPSSIA